jgi:hypothetical protein
MNKNTAKPNTASRMLSVLVLFGLLFSLFAVQGTYPASAQVEEPTDTPEINNDSELIISSAVEKISLFPEAITEGYLPFIAQVTSIYTNWSLVTLESYPVSINDDDETFVPNVLFAIGYLNENDEWEVYVEKYENEFYELIDRMPDEILSLEAKEIIIGDDVSSQSKAIVGLPWPIGTSWRYNQSPHGGVQGALDFGTPQQGVAATVHAADTGVVLYRYETCLATRRSDGVELHYQHIKPSDVSKWNIGQTINFTNPIGETTVSSGCGGSSSGHHLHFFLKKDGKYINIYEWSINGFTLSGNNLVRGSTVVRPNMSDRLEHIELSGGTLQPPHLNTPTSGQVLTSRTVNFAWTSPNSTNQNGYTFRLSSYSNPNTQPWIVDTGLGNHITSYSRTFSSDGTYYWHMRTWNTSGQASSWVTRSFNINTSTIGPRNAQFVSQNVPTTMIAGQQYTVSVTMKNTGSTTWTRANNFKLGSQNPRDNLTWLKTTNRVLLSSSDSIATNQTKTFTFTVTAPSNPGTHNFRWQMVQEGVAWFGDLTPNVAVNVQAGGSKPTTPSNPAPSNGATMSRTFNTTLSWSTNGTSCQVFVQGGSININPTGGCSSLALGQQRGGSYTWYVRATNSHGTTTGPTWTFKVQPHGASNFNATVVSANQINLSWTLSSDDDGTNIDGYDIYRNGSLIASVNKGVSSYQSSGLACNTSYSYYVRSKRQGVQSTDSNSLTRTTGACVPGTPSLNAPANNTVLNRTDSASLSWNSAANATHYYAEFSGGPNINLNSGWVTGTSWNIGSTWGGEYQWRVKSRNSSGVESGWSEVRKMSIRYGTPTSLSASGVSTTQINLSWGASSDAPGNIQGYRIYRNGTAIATVGSSTISYSDTSVACDTSYSYTVRAYKGDLESNASNTASATPANCPPAAPSNLAVSSVTPTSITLSWQDNSNNESGFRIYRWGDGANGWAFYLLATVGANATTYTQSGLACENSLNYYEIASYNSNSESERVGWVQGTTSACPPPVNDDFNSAKVISTQTYTDTLNTRGATVASDDPELLACSLGQGLATVWYRFTPTISGQILVDTVGSDYDTILAIWTGTRGNLVSQGCNDDRDYGDLQSELSLNVQAGVTYYIEVAQYPSASATGLSAQSTEKPTTLPSAPTPGNELGAQDVSGLSVGGTLKLNFKFHQADLVITSMSVSPANPPAHQPTSVIVQIRNQGQAPATDFWVDLFIDRQPQACQDLGDHWGYVYSIQPGETLGVTIPVSTRTSDGLAQGNHQLIAYVDVDCRVSESNETNNQFGPVNVSVGAPLPPPANNTFSNPKTILSTPYTDTLDTRGATVAQDDPEFAACELNAGKGTVWYKFTPTASGKVKITTLGSDYDTVLGLFTGTPGNLTLIACNDDIGWVGEGWNTASELFVPLNAGTTYYINVTKYGGAMTSSSGLEAQSRENTRQDNDEISAKQSAESDISAQSGGTLKLSVTGPGIQVEIGGNHRGAYVLGSQEAKRISYTGLNTGPVLIEDGLETLSSMRVLYAGVSYSEMMGFPDSQVTNAYIFPWYNNVAMNSQLRVSNLGNQSTTIRVYLGNQQIDSYTLAAGAANRKNYTGRNSGPLRVESSATNILTTIRVVYAGSSYSELMGYPVNQLTNEYLFPYYNNVAMNSQLRVSNLGSQSTTIRVYLGNEQIDTYTLAAGAATRKNYSGRNSGPLRVTSSNTDILSTIRVVFADNSYSELMGFPPTSWRRSITIRFMTMSTSTASCASAMSAMGQPPSPSTSATARRPSRH